ncbi:DUF6461 domain-containing protein [Streptomyces sp. NPDC091215]|uniref:DUF6461 domain-containing protein n=1 Tax=Streptomyces sp. NPDC091215 TaxID=3155192 RepID=UPI00344420A6
MTSATAHDYAWIRSSSWFRHALSSGYTLTLVRGVTPGDVMRVMAAEPQGTCTGVDAFLARQDELLDGTDYWEESFISGAFTVPGADGDWTLVLQHFEGGAGMQSRFLEALSAGGRAVVHSSNGGKPIHFFHWYEDGELRTTFEWPTARAGSTPDALNTVMREVGFVLSEEEHAAETHVDTKAAVFALAERLTGVRVTEELVRDAEYQLGHVPEEPDEDWTGIVIDITDAHGERLYKEFSRAEVDAAVERARAEANTPTVILGPSSPAP